MVRRFQRLFLLVFLAFSLAAAQTTSSATPSIPPAVMPTDPLALMQLAARVNGLDSPGMKPWHLKATYQTFDDQGKPKNQGTFEEWWAGPNKDKRTYVSPSFTQTEYITPDGRIREGDQEGPPLAEFMVRARLVSPMPTKKDLDGAQLVLRKDSYPKTQLKCVELARPMKKARNDSVLGLFPLYCFDPDKPIIRLSGSYGLLNSTYERIGELAGHYIGFDIRINDWKNTFATIHVEQANLLSRVDDADFIPPVEMPVLPATGTVTVAASVLKGNRLGGSVPNYPREAKQDRIQGTVQLSALIAEDGHIRELRVIGAPDPTLALSALIAVHDWVYKPYLLNGHPVEVQTTINVIYQLGR